MSWNQPGPRSDTAATRITDVICKPALVCGCWLSLRLLCWRSGAPHDDEVFKGCGSVGSPQVSGKEHCHLLARLSSPELDRLSLPSFSETGFLLPLCATWHSPACACAVLIGPVASTAEDQSAQLKSPSKSSPPWWLTP